MSPMKNPKFSVAASTTKKPKTTFSRFTRTSRRPVRSPDHGGPDGDRRAGRPVGVPLTALRPTPADPAPDTTRPPSVADGGRVALREEVRRAARQRALPARWVPVKVKSSELVAPSKASPDADCGS